ncbi:DUF1501 domain-containing protein [Psychroflexus tropicus]|uniref:DUF1501 domain-containing protein n=1 Tax=Psychroflexus tropicus TaxID=197345 RepID=UPI00037B262F|nr:DUF1501 domain-containing protein [Psychroflexus tropicus]
MCHDTLKHNNWSRRGFLKGSGMALFGLTLGGLPSFVARAAEQVKEQPLFKRKKTLVTIFQRGAMDGLAAVQPLGNSFLQTSRPDIYFPYSGNGEKIIALNDDYGLNPYLEPLKKLWDDGQMNIVHGMGIPLENRSHFDMQDFMESGTPGKKATKTGWLNRAMQTDLKNNDTSPFRAVAMSPTRPRILYGEQSSITVEKLEDLRFSTTADKRESVITDEELNGIGQKYSQVRDERLKNAGKNGLEAIKILKRIELKTDATVAYPKSTLGNSLRQIAQLIKAGVGLEIAFAESTGWDTHSRQATRLGGFARQARDLSASIAAFWEDISNYKDDVVVVTMTEFGRTTRQNGSTGTDHGRGSCQFIIGNEVASNQIFHKLDTINEETCDRELPVTTDFRDVMSTVLSHHLGLDNNSIFPNWRSTQLPIFA